MPGRIDVAHQLHCRVVSSHLFLSLFLVLLLRLGTQQCASQAQPVACNADKIADKYMREPARRDDDIDDGRGGGGGGGVRKDNNNKNYCIVSCNASI